MSTPYVIPVPSELENLPTNIATDTGFSLSLYQSPDAVDGSAWLVSEALLGATVPIPTDPELVGTIATWMELIDPADWAETASQHLEPNVLEGFHETLGMPSVEDPRQVQAWAAWNQYPLRHGRMYTNTTAASEHMLTISDHAIVVNQRFRSEAAALLSIPQRSSIALPEVTVTDALWRIATICHELDLVEAGHAAITSAAELYTISDYEDLRELAWRGNSDAKSVIATLTTLEGKEGMARDCLDDIAAEVEFAVKEIRLSQKQAQVARGRRRAEALRM